MEKKKSKWLTTIIQLSCGLAFGALIGISIGIIFESEFEASFLFICLPILIAAYFIQIIVHEGGHLIFGLLTGYKFVSFRIASFICIKENHHLVIKRFAMAGTAGQCLLAPPPYDSGHYPIVLYNLGGSLMNFIVSFICFILFYLFRDISTLSFFFFITMLIGLYFGIVNGIPLTIGGLNNDGFNAFNTNKDAITKQAFWLTLKINEYNSQGLRLKDIDDELFPMLEANDIKNSLTASLVIMNIQRALDQHDFDKAEALFDFINNHQIPIMGLHQSIATNDYIYCLLISNNFTNIQSFYTKPFKQFIKAMKKTLSVIRTQYTFELLYNKDEEKAKKHLAFFNHVIKTYPYQCEIESERELMDYAYQIYQQGNIKTLIS